ncbi:glutamate racemase [Lacibacter luteus]|uniref:Glutamate racemase n=1 Tax=Lacibacter luteus TaxID=2508719 RepID=A0A4Q1CII7_9BACT|nr:glutamate racemase [Lacibacter luteus]RXK60421.1 glutamate racemase [Lacibacter luteus]
MHSGPIGIFDSGYGGLTVMKEIVQQLPQYNYIYLGDNARAPYGTRSFETVYRYTLECVEWFFKQGCPLVILACNTASAKALRSIQQNDLQHLNPDNRVLGVIRPTAEVIGQYSETKNVGVLATVGTVQSGSYEIEITKFYPEINVYQQACPMWVPLIENNEHENAGADYFVKEYVDALVQQSQGIDTVLLGCTHYPLLQQKIKAVLPDGVTLLSQGKIVAESLADYLQRHPEMEDRLSKDESRKFFTTDSVADFDRHAGLFYGVEVRSAHVELGK